MTPAATATQIAGLELPFLSEPDPDLLGEGSLDPLGLARFAERLAEALLPDMTARMQRLRFLTAIAVGAAAIEGLEEVPPRDGVTHPSVALEWNVVEAFARTRGLPRPAVERLPGIEKARAAIARRGRLDAGSYLRAPRVFGFFGVYKRLGTGMGIVDADLFLGDRGEELLRSWEADEPTRAGYVDQRSSQPGGKLRRHLRDATSTSLRSGRASLEPGSQQWSKITEAFRPDTIGANEKRYLLDRLTDPSRPHRAEIWRLMRRYDRGGSESDAMDDLLPHASVSLSRCIAAIQSYEHVARLLSDALTAVQTVSTAHGWVTPSQIASHRAVKRCLRELPGTFRTCEARLEEFGLAYDVSLHLDQIPETRAPADFVDQLLAHHERVQESKPPGKRAWFERSQQGICVRPPYRLDEPPPASTFVHPYRVDAVRRFIGDAR